MTAKIIDGHKIAQEILASLRINELNKPPHLVAIRANDDAGSNWYAQAQAQHCTEHKIKYTLKNLGANADEKTIIAALEHYNNDHDVSAILLHLPLPPHCDYLSLIEKIDPRKDAEGVHPYNLGKLLAVGKNIPAPCTAMSAVHLVKSVAEKLNGKKALVIGRSAIVGKPAALLLLNLNATPIIAHSQSNLAELSKDADVIIAATGACGIAWKRYQEKFARYQNGQTPKPSLPDLTPLLKREMVKKGAIVIDVGVSQIPRALDENGCPTKNAKGKDEMIYVGDVDFENVQAVAAYITPPQGGVGPVTNAFLLKNIVDLMIKNANNGD